MQRLLILLLFVVSPPLLAASAAPVPAAASAAPAVASSKQIEKELQRLSWPQFKAVVEAVPKIRADVDAYGPTGWDFVRANYRAWPWKKSVDKLDDAQKTDLLELIRKAKKGELAGS